MPQYNNILNIPELRVTNIDGVNPIYIGAEATHRPKCPKCHSSQLHLKKTLKRQLHHESIGKRKCYLRLIVRQFRCRDCNRYFHESFTGIRKWKRATTAFRAEVFHLHNEGISQSSLSKSLHISSASIERWYQEIILWRNENFSEFVLPKYLGLDEHTFSKKMGYITTMCDLKNRRIYDLIPGRSEKALSPKLGQLKGKEKVQMVCMDLCDTYRAIAKIHFPNARIVADRFHVIRLVNHHFLKTWQTLDPKAKHSRGLLALMRRHYWRLSDEQKTRLKVYLKSIDGLGAIYFFKQDLVKLLLFRTTAVKYAKRRIKTLLHFISQLKESGFKHLATLGSTIENWQEEIVAMWRFPLTNSITEGFHRKMKLIQRRAYGFKNFQNYRLRVRSLCI